MDVDKQEAAVAVAVPRGQPHVCTLAPEDEQCRQLGTIFQSHDLDSEFDPFSDHHNNNQQHHQEPQLLVDLNDVLGGLKRTDDSYGFLPGRIYVRRDMRRIFNYFRNDVLYRDSNRVLLGSPGVGTSVLSFIAALFQAERKSPSEQPVVYVG